MADVAKVFKIKLVKGKDYSVFGKVFEKDKAVVVTEEESKYLLADPDKFFEAVVETPSK